MRAKRNRSRKRLYIPAAGIIIILITGCAMLAELPFVEREARESLITARHLLNAGDYDGALKENRKILSSYGNIPPGDESLFMTGLIYAHYGNPGRDYEKPLAVFKRLVKVFPQSPLSGEAKIWIGILQEQAKLTAKTEDLNKGIRKLQSENERLQREIDELKMTIKKSKQVDIEIDGKTKELSP